MKRIIERRYGHGAAHVAIRGAPLRRRSTPSLRDGWSAALREEGDGIRSGAWRALTRNAAPTLAAIFVSIMLGAFLRERPDASATQIIPFEEPMPVAMEEPEPEPEPVVEPEPEPEPVEVAAVTPEPPPPAVVPEPPKPAPPPPPRTPKPEPPRRTPPPPRIDPAPAPVIARAPEPAPPPRPRAAPPTPARSAPPLAFAAAPLPSEAADEPTPTRRSPAFQTARPADARMRPALDALEAPQDDQASPSTTRSSRVAASPAAPNRKAAPLDFAAAAPPAAPGEPRRESPTRRPVAATPPRRRERGNPAALGVPAAPGRDSDPPAETASAPRSARPAAPAATGSRREEPGLRGVALASLDACRSDRDEDALKQRVVAAAEDRGRCESAAGRFYFVETKNLNAFLMRIERAPGRRLGDRCSELLHALDCLAKSR